MFTSAIALILSVMLLDRRTILCSLRSFLKRRAQSRTRSSGLGDTRSAKLLGENKAIGLKEEPELIFISSSMHWAEGVAGGVGATGSISDVLCTWIHQLSFSMHSSIHWSIEVAFDDLLNRPSLCFMESNSLITEEDRTRLAL